MTTTSRVRRKPLSNRLTTCAERSCNRPFAVCGECDRGRRFCCRQCADKSRRASLRRAGRHYQATDRGRSLHAIRQARYRERVRAVTHQSRGADPKKQPETAGSATRQSAPPVVRSELCLPPACAVCCRPGVFLRNGFLDRARRRHESRPGMGRWGSQRVRVRSGHAIRAACAWAFETTGMGRVEPSKRDRKITRRRPRSRGATNMPIA
jgi:hypothetical protein